MPYFDAPQPLPILLAICYMARNQRPSFALTLIAIYSTKRHNFDGIFITHLLWEKTILKSDDCIWKRFLENEIWSKLMSHISETFREISWKSTVNYWQKFMKVHHLIQQRQADNREERYWMKVWSSKSNLRRSLQVGYCQSQVSPMRFSFTKPTILVELFNGWNW